MVEWAIRRTSSRLQYWGGKHLGMDYANQCVDPVIIQAEGKKLSTLPGIAVEGRTWDQFYIEIYYAWRYMKCDFTVDSDIPPNVPC